MQSKSTQLLLEALTCGTATASAASGIGHLKAAFYFGNMS